MTQTEINHDAKEVKQAPKKAPNQNFVRNKNKEAVRGKFHFHEVPGGTLSFSILIDKGDKVTNYTLVDQEVYSIPLGVAKHLNTNCWYPTYGYIGADQIQASLPTSLYGASGQHMKINQKIRRCSFQSLEFLDIDEVNNQVTSVEHI